jgi:carbon-monoxide dehydrogenase large subunit
MTVTRFGIGQPVRRREDQRFLTGQGRYVDDIDFDMELHGFVLRSPHAHAEILAIDCAEAAVQPGVVAVLTGADLAKDGLGHIQPGIKVTQASGEENFTPPHPALAQGRVRHVGEPVAFVVAESLDAARDAAELVEVEYRELPAHVLTATASADEAPRIYDDAPQNVCYEWEKGDKSGTDAAFAGAAHVIGLDIVNSRVVVNPMEPRGCVGLYDSEAETYTLHNSGQAVHALRRMLAGDVFHIPQERLRVASPDVGGGFGTKNFVYPEQVLVLWAARRTGRPVKWVAQRTEDFLSDTQGRDHAMRAELALDADARFLAFRIRTTANLGAYVSTFGAMIPTNPVAVVLGGVYDIPSVHYHVTAVLTNTVSVDAYRGAGRPEASFAIERLVDHAAAELGIDPIELRRRNFVRPEAMPYKTSMGSLIDCGEFERILDRALEAGDYADFPARRAAAERKGLLRGLGVACYFEATLGIPTERKEIRFDDDGVTVIAGTMSNGQGHETTYAQVLHERLGLPLDAIRVIQGDTEHVPTGGGHGGSRSMEMGANALVVAADRVAEKAKRIAAHHFEVAAGDIEVVDGGCRVVGTDLSISLLDLAKIARDPARLPAGVEPGLDAEGSHERQASTFPNGCHIVEVEIDPETGRVRLDRYTVVDDFGTLLNPLLIAGQVHGGVAQGIGQALLEHTVYDPDGGQLLTGSFMDYCMPRADDLPSFEVGFESVPTKSNPLGIKGCGEAGCIGALPATINAVIDGLAPLGIRDIEMPATPERVWRAIRQASAERQDRAAE